MSVKEIKALVRRFFEEWNRGKANAIAVIDEVFATDFVCHRGTGEVVHGLKDWKQANSKFYDTFPDNHLTLDDMVAEGDKVAYRWTLTGTHKGEFEGIRPTDKKVTMWAISISRIAGGKIVEDWSRVDTLGLMRQLGVVPTPEKGR